MRGILRGIRWALVLTLALVFLLAGTALAAGPNEEGYQFLVNNIRYEVTASAAGVNPGEVTIIGNVNFTGVLNISQVTDPTDSSTYNVTEVGIEAFKDCTDLTTVTLPNVTHIGNYAFYSCTNLAEVNMSMLNSIGAGAFATCSNLNDVTLPMAGDIGQGAFSQCTGLTSIDLPEATIIGQHAFMGCTQLATVKLPKVVRIENNTFNGCTELIDVNLASAEFIGIQAFIDCSSLTSITLPEAITIDEYAFFACSALSSADIPKATTIADGAFRECASLTSVNLPSAEYIGLSAFRECASLTSVNLPKVTAIGARAFRDCLKLASVVMPKVTAIGEDAFNNCTSLANLTMGARILPTNFHENAFNNVPLPLNIYVPRGMGTYYRQFLQGGANPRFPAGTQIIEPPIQPDPTYTLTVSAPAFGAVTVGYERPDARPLTITSSGNTASTIRSVESDSMNFEIGGSGTTVPAGGSIDTWTVRPAAGLAAGQYSATITVTYNGGATATARVSFTVNESPMPPVAVTGIKTLTKVYVQKGKTLTLPYWIEPDGASDKAVRWSSANKKIATVSATGKVKGVKAGKSVLVNVTSADGTVGGQTRVYVVQWYKALKSLGITPSKAASLSVGQTLQIKAKLNPLTATGVAPRYATSNPGVAKVDAFGKVTATGAGQAKITVKAGSKTKSLVVTVN